MSPRTTVIHAGLGMVGVAALIMSAPAAAQGQRCAAEPTLYSVQGDQPTIVTFFNSSRITIRIYWINYQGRRELFSTVRPGQRYSANTFASHPWIVTDLHDNCHQVVFAERDEMTFTYR